MLAGANDDRRAELERIAAALRELHQRAVDLDETMLAHLIEVAAREAECRGPRASGLNRIAFQLARSSQILPASSP